MGTVCYILLYVTLNNQSTVKLFAVLYVLIKALESLVTHMLVSSSTPLLGSGASSHPWEGPDLRWEGRESAIAGAQGALVHETEPGGGGACLYPWRHHRQRLQPDHQLHGENLCGRYSDSHISNVVTNVLLSPVDKGCEIKDLCVVILSLYCSATV